MLNNAKKIFLITTFDEDAKLVRRSIDAAISRVQKLGRYRISLVTLTSQEVSLLAPQILSEIEHADLVVGNLSTLNPNSMYEIGIAHAMKKPIVLLVNNAVTVPFEFIHYRYINYSSSTIGSDSTIDTIARGIEEALDEPTSWLPIEASVTPRPVGRKTVFVSYSHRDSDYLERLKVHIKPLERKGAVELWADTRLKGGDKWQSEIERALNKAAIAVLLVSADFLASDFIVDNELQPLLKDAETKGTIIIPMIVKPCRFLREPTISQFQSINEPNRPLVSMPEYERESVYERLAERIEVAVGSN